MSARVQSKDREIGQLRGQAASQTGAGARTAFARRFSVPSPLWRGQSAIEDGVARGSSIFTDLNAEGQVIRKR